MKLKGERVVVNHKIVPRLRFIKFIVYEDNLYYLLYLLVDNIYS